MTRTRFRHWLGAVASAALLLGSATFAAHAGDMSLSGPSVTVTGDGGSVRAAGANVTITGNATHVDAAGAVVTTQVTTTENLRAAGAQVTIDAASGRSLEAFGAVVTVRGHVAYNVTLGGAVISSDVTAGGWVKAFGAAVTFGPDTDVTRTLDAGGASVTVDGHIAGKVTLAGALVTFNGKADGPVEITAKSVVIGPAAQIGGNLLVRSTSPPEISPTAVITGTTTTVAPPEWVPRITWVWWLAIAAAIAVGTLLAGIVLLLFGGHVFATATEHVRHRPLSSFLFGILTVVLVPFIAIVLMVTVVGISVGIAVLFLMPFLLTFGHAVAAAGIAAGLVIRRPGELGVLLSLVMLVVGAVILAALGFIPVVGPLIVLVAIVLGVGAFTRTLGHRLRRTDPARLPV